MVLQENATDKIKISSCPRKKLVEVCPQIWRGKPTWQFSALHAVSLDMFRKCKSPYHCQVRSGQGWSSDSRTNFSQAQCPKTTICSSNIHSSHTSLRLNLHHLFKGIFWYDSNLSPLFHPPIHSWLTSWMTKIPQEAGDVYSIGCHSSTLYQLYPVRCFAKP